MVHSDPENPAEGRPNGARREEAEPPPRFIVGPEDVADGIVRLRGSEGHHAKNVLHLGRGDPFVALDGRGAEYEATVEIRTPDGLIGKVLRTTRRSREPLARVALAQALVKPPALAAVVHQATALGAHEFVVFECARSLRREFPPRERRHLEAVAQAAVKQSLRSVVPRLSGPQSFAETLKYGRDFELAFQCRPEATATPLAAVVGEGRPGPSRFVVMVGPEGGFTADEEEQATGAGWRPLDLGPRRLRTELAGPVACALILHAVGDLGPLGRSGE
ncbi:MAG: 16S rRNA (uracil(1498)-N(3))-methyltransferase [Candidatus Coatesbacteria bacterium]|nr:MAG: 16S rRNA (uracil(1498)-N(3))-methyltransferase [Candidatus Coatesbacteria bacterium]